MPVEHHDKAYGDRTLTRVVVVIAALMLIGFFIIPVVTHAPPITAPGYILIGVWGIALVLGTIWACRVQLRYRCPKCGAHLPPVKTDSSTNFQHRFHCAACDILWTADVYTGDNPIDQTGRREDCPPTSPATRPPRQE